MFANNSADGTTASFCKWHGLVVLGISARCPNRVAVSAMTVQGYSRTKLATTFEALESQRYWHLCPALPSGFPRPAPRRMLWMAFDCKLHQFSARDSDAQYSPWSNTETKHNTKRIRITPCMAIDGSVACLCMHHHGWLHILCEWKHRPKCQSFDPKSKLEE